MTTRKSIDAKKRCREDVSRLIKSMIAALVLALLFGAGVSRASTDISEVGALLVYPVVYGLPHQETYLLVTNTTGMAVNAHVTFIDGFAGTPEFPNPSYCNECDFSFPMTANDTEMIAVSKNPDGHGVNIDVVDAKFRHSCPQMIGMVVITLEDDAGQTLTDNILLGDEIVVDYARGHAYSIPAVPFQGGNSGNGDRVYNFDDSEFGKLPRVLATGFIAPDRGTIGPVTAEIILFTLGFNRLNPPRTDCSVTGYDADENQFSSSVQFGCWDVVSLSEISTEFAYPNLGLSATSADSHGWLTLKCEVDRDGDGHFEALGGVHGAIVQKFLWPFGAPRRPFNTVPTGPTAWGMLLKQSVTTGDTVTLELGGGAIGLDP